MQMQSVATFGRNKFVCAASSCIRRYFEFERNRKNTKSCPSFKWNFVDGHAAVALALPMKKEDAVDFGRLYLICFIKEQLLERPKNCK